MIDDKNDSHQFPHGSTGAFLSDDFGHPPDLSNVQSGDYEFLDAESGHLDFFDYGGCRGKRRHLGVGTVP
jgi:hypothetical protein